MPIYEYVCTVCGARFERLVRMSAAQEPVQCPDCQGEARRVFSTFAIAGSASGSGEKADDTPAPDVRAPVTPKEDIDHWRRLSKKKS